MREMVTKTNKQIDEYAQITNSNSGCNYGFVDSNSELGFVVANDEIRE